MSSHCHLTSLINKVLDPPFAAPYHTILFAEQTGNQIEVYLPHAVILNTMCDSHCVESGSESVVAEQTHIQR